MIRIALPQRTSLLLLRGLICLAGATAPPLLAAELPITPRWEKASLRLGAFLSDFDSSLGFVVGPGIVELDGEDLLGLPGTTTVFRADALYRPGKSRRHQFDFSYAAYRREGSANLAGPIDLGGGVVIPATRVDSVLNFDIIRLSYSYAFIQNDHVRIGAGLSAYVLPVEYGLDLAFATTPPAVRMRDFILPVPAVAVRADFRLWRQLYLTTELNGIYLDILGFEGSLIDASVAAEYRFWKHLTLGVAYNGMLVDVRAKNDSSYPGTGGLGSVNVGFQGPMAFAKLTF